MANGEAEEKIDETASLTASSATVRGEAEAVAKGTEGGGSSDENVAVVVVVLFGGGWR